jgi:Bacterial PH domain
MDPITLSLAALIVAILVLVPVWIIWRKGRPVAPGEVFRTSRLSSGHKLFPTQVIITPNSVVHHTPQWIGRHEHSIHIAHVASVSIDTGLIFSDVIIETTGGTGSIRCRGHRKADAIRMKQLIETHQTAYYRGSASSAAPGPGPALPPS